jgi:hypothetical protein
MQVKPGVSTATFCRQTPRAVRLSLYLRAHRGAERRWGRVHPDASMPDAARPPPPDLRGVNLYVFRRLGGRLAGHRSHVH